MPVRAASVVLVAFMNIIVERARMAGIVKGGSFAAIHEFVLIDVRTYESDMTNKQKFVGLRLTRRCKGDQSETAGGV